jgi:hypothetical protein
MRNRVGFGARHLTVVCGAFAALALVPATASAVTSAYHPIEDARTFRDNAGGWGGSASYGPGCLAGTNCPAITNTFRDSGGVDGPEDGFLRTGLTGLTALLGATSTGTWTSPDFTYAGAGGVQPNSVAFTMALQATVGGLVNSGSSVTYSVALEEVPSGDSQTLVPVTTIPANSGWTGVSPVALSPGDLSLGQKYRLRISTIYSTVAALLPDARVEFDNVALVAQAPGGGAGAGGGVAGGGLASKTVVMKGDKLRVKVRCGRAVQGRCKIKMVGLWKKAGPRVTKLRKVFVRSGKTKKVSMKLRPRAIAAVATRDRIWVAIKVNANGFKTPSRRWTDHQTRPPAGSARTTFARGRRAS